MRIFGLMLVVSMLAIAAGCASTVRAQAQEKSAPSASATPDIPNCSEHLAVLSRVAIGTWKQQRDQYEQVLAAAQVRIADLERQLAEAKKPANATPKPEAK